MCGLLSSFGLPCLHAQSGRRLRTSPLHESQQIIIDNDKELRIKLKIFITEDFVMEILSYGERVRVIEPKTLAEQIRSIHEEAAEGYG